MCERLDLRAPREKHHAIVIFRHPRLRILSDRVRPQGFGVGKSVCLVPGQAGNKRHDNPRDNDS